MSSAEDVLRGLSLVGKSAGHLMEEDTREQELGPLGKVLDVLNRGTEGTASAFDELLFEPTPDPVGAWFDGIKGKGRVQNFGDVAKRAGWDPKSKSGKAAKFMMTLGLDIGLDPLTYLSLGAAPLAKHIPKAAGLLEAGKSTAEIGAKFGKGTGKAAKLLRRAEKFQDPKVDEVLAKTLRGDKLTRAEESVLDARTMLGLQTPFGTNVVNLVPKEASVKFYSQMGQVHNWLDTAPVISPVIHGFGKAFNAFYDLKRKVPEFMKLRRMRDQKINYATAQGFERAIKSISKLANGEERRWITELMEMPEDGVIASQIFKDITPIIDNSPQMWEDLGLKVGQDLNEEDAVELVNYWMNNFNKWISEFGPEGIMNQQNLKGRVGQLSDAIKQGNDRVTQLESTLKGLPTAVDGESSKIAAARTGLMEELDNAARDLDEFTSMRTEAEEELQRLLGPDAHDLKDFDLGSGAFGQVKGRWDILKFQGHVIKLPVALDVESFGSMVVEHKVYQALKGIPGIGSSKLVFKEMPLDEAVAHQDALFPKTFGRGTPGSQSDDLVGALKGTGGDTAQAEKTLGEMGLSDLAQSGFIITKTDGKRYLKVPHLVKDLVDIDDLSTRRFHASGGNAHWNMPVKAIREFEKILKRSSQSGVHLSDLTSGNLVIDKKGKVHLLDLGYGNEINKTPEGLQSSWRKNLLRFADHVVNRTRFTSKEAQEQLAPLIKKFIDPGGGHMGISGKVTREEVKIVQEILKKVGMPLRHLTEKGSTQPLVEGFRKVARPDVQLFKMKQRGLAEERNVILEKLSPTAREAYDNVMLWKREMTDRLLSNGLLTEEWITNFETKFGIPHLRHMKAEEGLVRRFQHAISLALTKKAGTLKARQMEGTIKEIHDRMGKEFFETDIARIMFSSEVEVTTAIENWKLLNKVAENLDWTKDAIPLAKRVPIKRGKSKGEFRTVDTFQAEEGYSLINHPLFEGSQVREEIAEDINKMITKTRGDMGHQLIKKWYDPAHKWLRAYTLFLFPSYHIRNFAGAVWNNFLADVDVTDHFRAHKVIFGGKKVERWSEEFGKGMPFSIDGISAPNPNQKLSFPIDGKHMTHQQLLDEANEFGVMGRGQMGPHGDIERGMAGELGSIFPKKGAEGVVGQLGTDNTLVQFGARVGTQVENVVRLAHYMSKRKSGLSAMDSALSVKKYQFDYQDLSDFERNWLKRTFFFYTWTRKNVPLQAKMFLNRPGKFTAGLKAKEEVETQFGGPEPDQKLVPEWLHDQLGMRFQWNKKDGTYEYFLLGSWWPAADLNRIFDPADELVGMASPLLKVPIEQFTNKNTFFDAPIEKIPGERKEFVTPEAGKILGDIPGSDAVAKLLFGAPLEEGVTVPARLHHILRQFRPANEARRWAEAVARGGPQLGLINSLIGKSYEFNPDRARKGKDYEIKMQMGVLKSKLRKAQKRGQPSEVRRLRAEILRLQEELIR